MILTVGDPRGIGADVVAQAVERYTEEGGEPDRLRVVAPGNSFSSSRCPCPVLDIEPWDGTESGAGRATVEGLRRAVDTVLSAGSGAVVTGPAHKPALHAAGFAVPGQTELLQQLTRSRRVGMLMAAERTALGGSPLRVLLATTHMPLRAIFDILTEELLVEQAELLARELRGRWGIPSPKVALCGLNPHASDGGLFGDEEERIMVPAVARLQGMEIEANGPFPADTVFRRALEGEFDAVVAPYHDVGMAAFKSVAFGTGVNTTLGLPFPRTSPDHGTAFHLKGTGRADASSTLEALRLALRLSEKAALTGPTRRI